MAGSNGGGGNTGGGARGRPTTRSRAADRHVHVDDEENVFRGLGDIVNVGLNPPQPVHENVVAEIGGIENIVNLADPLHQQIPSAIGGSNAVMSGAPVGEGNTGSHGDGGNTGSGRRRRSIRSKELNPLLDYENSSQIGENLVNLADPNAFLPQIPAAIGGSEVAMAAAPMGEGDPIPNPPLVDENVPPVIEGSEVVAAPPIGEGDPQNQGRRRARHNPPQRRTRPRREAAQNPQPEVPIEHEIPDMGPIPDDLQVSPHHLYRLCRKKLTNSDLITLNITGENRPYLKHMATQAGLSLADGHGRGRGLPVAVQVFNEPHPLIGTVLYLRNAAGDALTLAWRELFTSMGCLLAAEQYIDMWFEMAPKSMNIYIQGRQRNM